MKKDLILCLVVLGSVLYLIGEILRHFTFTVGLQEFGIFIRYAGFFVLLWISVREVIAWAKQKSISALVVALLIMGITLASYHLIIFASSIKLDVCNPAISNFCLLLLSIWLVVLFNIGTAWALSQTVLRRQKA